MSSEAWHSGILCILLQSVMIHSNDKLLNEIWLKGDRPMKQGAHHWKWYCSLESQNWHGFATLRNGIPLEWYIELSRKPKVGHFQEPFVKSQNKDSGWIQGAVWRDGTHSPLRDLLSQFSSAVFKADTLSRLCISNCRYLSTDPWPCPSLSDPVLRLSAPLWLLDYRVFDLGLSWCK